MYDLLHTHTHTHTHTRPGPNRCSFIASIEAHANHTPSHKYAHTNVYRVRNKKPLWTKEKSTHTHELSSKQEYGQNKPAR